MYPRQAIQRCSGGATLWGVESHLFDLDWSDFSPIWAYLITTSSEATALNLEPDLTTTGPGVFVPDIPNSGLTSPSPGRCPKPGYVGGWILRDLFADTATGSMIPLMQATEPSRDDYFTADGTVDWSFVHFFPGHNQTGGKQDIFAPSPNGCGSGFSGSASFQWLGSTDGVAPLGDGGENAALAIPDPCTDDPSICTGIRSRYGGFRIGGNGAPGSSLIPETLDGGADLEFLFGEATLNLRVNTQYSVVGVIAPQLGMAGLEFPIGWDTITGAPALKDGDGGIPGAVNATIGVQLYNQSASTATSLGAFSANVDTSGGAIDLLIDAGLCFPLAGGQFALNPFNPIFGPLFNTTLAALTPFTADPANVGEVVYVSAQFGLAPDPTLLGTTLAFQGWEFDLLAPPGSEIAESSQVIRMNLRHNKHVN